MQGLQYGANWSWCGHCHHKLRFQIESTRFHQLQSSALDTSGWLTIFVFCSNKTIRSLVLNVSHYMHNFLCHSMHYRPIHEFKLLCKLMYFPEQSCTFCTRTLVTFCTRVRQLVLSSIPNSFFFFTIPNSLCL